jgi:hypothetical protein
LQETSALISSVNPAMGEEFKARFMARIPPSTAALDVQLKHYVVAKRCARMVLAVSSTHDEYPNQWVQILDIVVRKVREGNDVVSRFQGLGASDRNALISHLKVSEYAQALVAMCEIGLWVAASCLEAMVHETIAQEVYFVCQDLLKLVDELWGMGSRVSFIDALGSF